MYGRLWICDPLLRRFTWQHLPIPPPCHLHSGHRPLLRQFAVSVDGNCSTMTMAPASGYGKRSSFKQRVLMITHGGNYQLPQCKRLSRFLQPCLQPFFLPPYCMYMLHLRLMHWTSVGPHSLSMRLQVVVATTLMASMSNQTSNCYQPHVNLQQKLKNSEKEVPPKP